MSLDAPVFKFNNLYNFSSQFQKNIKSFENEYSKKFEKVRDLSILNLISSNINVSLDIIRSKDFFDINFSNFNSVLSFDNYQLEQIISTYISIVDKLTLPINSIIYLFNNNTNNIHKEFTKTNNKLLSDLLNEIRKKDDPLQVIDIYISEYMNVPKSSDNIINFIYFIRRFPLIRYLLNRYLYENVPECFKKIRNHNLDNIKYLLYIKEGKTTKEFEDLKFTGLYDFDSDYGEGYDNYLARKKDPSYVFNDIFNNTFLNNTNGCINRNFKRYNTICAIENKNRIENIIYLFPFLYNFSEIFELKREIKTILKKIKFNEYGIQEFQDKTYIRDVNQIFYIILKTPDLLIDRNTSFELLDIGRNESILKEFLFLFCYDLILNEIDINNVFEQLNLEDILIKMSTFILNVYGVYKRSEIENLNEKEIYRSIYFDPNNFVPISNDIDNPVNQDGFDIIPDDIVQYQNDYNLLVPNLAKNLSFFYIFAAYRLFSNIKFRNLVENSLYKLSHLFYIFNFFSDNAKDLYPLFIFGAFSDGEYKWIKNYNYEKNYFLEWLNEYYDDCFKNTDKFVIE